LAAAIDEDMIKLGEAMSHGLKPALDALTAEMPKLEHHFVELGKATAGAIDMLVEMGGMVKKAVKTANSADNDWGQTGSDAYKAEYDRRHGHIGAYDEAMNPRANALRPGDKVISLEVLEKHAAAQNEKLDKVLNTLTAWSASS